MYPPVTKRVDHDAVETTLLTVPRQFRPRSGSIFLDLVEGQIMIDLGAVPRPPGRRNHDRHEVGDEVRGKAEYVSCHAAI